MERFPRPDLDPETRLRPRDRLFLWACIAAAAATLTIGLLLYPRVNPEASIRFDVDRRGSEEVAVRFLRDLGVDPAEYRHAARFVYEDDQKVFLERSLGLARANELMSGPVRMWRWGHRWFRSLEKEELKVEVSVQGTVAAFDHQIAEEAPGASLGADSARVLAERFLHGPLRLDVSRLSFEGVETQSRPARVDHTFTWKRQDLALADGDQRYTVRIQGAEPGAFREFVHIPEGWARDYQRLRSLNESASVAASALSILIFIAALIVLFVRMRGRDLRWRPALGFGLGGVGLAFLASLNGLPNSFYDAETTASLGGFVLGQLLQALLSSLLLGMFIFLLAAAGESVYRERYPERISLGRLFTRRALRTRRFLLHAVLGLAMTCFFFCYQEVFYAVAQHFGAWAPMEVPYSDLLNTAIPWAFILLIGFMPAVTEEFGFRLFPIPFLQKHLRSRWLAVILPAFIWGFAHSSYPNQPFFIRGLEVGLAGVLVGFIMLRVGILAPLVWHYTVDALYSSTLLFRSGNPYYIISAALAGGVILLPILWAAVAYLRSGRFEDPREWTNEAESARRQPGPTGEGGAPAGETIAPGRESDPAATDPGADAGTARGGWSKRRRWAAVAFAAGGALLLFIPGESVDDALALRVGRSEARAAAERALTTIGESPDSYRVNLTGGRQIRWLAARYLLESGGPEGLRRYLTETGPPLRWEARFFRPLEAREVRVEVDASSGRVISVRRHLAEKDSLPPLAPAQAESLARGFLAARGIDLSRLVLRDMAEERRPHRVDRSFLFEAIEGDPRNVGEARHGVSVRVTGDRVGAWSDTLKLPEDWMRRREKQTLWTTLGSALPLLAYGGLAGLLLWQLLLAHRERRVPWRRCLFAASFLAVLGLAGSINEWPLAMERYVTAIPWDVYRLTAMIALGLGLVTSFLLFGGGLAMGTAAWPEAVRTLASARTRRQLLPDALLAGAAGLGVLLGTRHLSEVALRLWPAVAPLPSLGLPRAVEGVSVSLDIIWLTVRSLVLAIVVGAAALRLLQGRTGSRRAWAMLVLIWLAMAVPGAHSVAEVGVRLGLAGVKLAALLWAMRLFLPGNPLAWPVAVTVALTAANVLPYLKATGGAYRSAGIAALLVLLTAFAIALLAGNYRAARRSG